MTEPLSQQSKGLIRSLKERAPQRLQQTTENVAVRRLAESDYQRRRQEFDDPESGDRLRRQYILRGEGRTYNQIAEENGVDAADAALERSLRRAAQRYATKEVERRQANRERREIDAEGRNGNAATDEQRAAINRLRPEYENRPIATFTRENPGEIEKLVQRYRRLTEQDQKVREAIEGETNPSLLEQRAAIDRLRPQDRGTSLATFNRENPGEIGRLVQQYRREVELDAAMSLDAILERGRSLSDSIAQNIEGADLLTQLDVMRGFRQRLIDTGLQRQEAEAIASRIDYDKSIDRLGSDARQRVQNIATEYFQMTGGRGAGVQKYKRDRDRAYADQPSKSINVGNILSKRIIFHEQAHHMEFDDPRIYDAAVEWRSRRATGDAQPLGRGYDANERAIPGNFVDKYVGTIYPHRSTEVVSMGIEHFATEDGMLNLYNQDREHFDFILGVLRNDPIPAQ